MLGVRSWGWGLRVGVRGWVLSGWRLGFQFRFGTGSELVDDWDVARSWFDQAGAFGTRT